MKMNVKRYFSVFITAVLLSAFFSCTPKQKDTPKAEAVGIKTAAGNSDKQKDANTEPDGDNPAYSVVGEPEGKDFLLFHETDVDPTFPEDFEIGPLQPLSELDDTEKLIYKTAVDFADSIIINKTDTSLVYSRRQDFVVRNLNDMLSGLQLSGYRFGIIDSVSEPASADIRITEKNGYLFGTMYFAREDKWKVLDLQLTYINYSGEEKVTAEKWFPLYNKESF